MKSFISFKKRALLFSLFFSSTLISYGQEVKVEPILVDPPYFFCIVAGIVLAGGFQLLFFLLSITLGITAVGDLRKSTNSSHSTNTSESFSIPEKISLGLVLWTMLSLSISLFLASFFAVKLSLITWDIVGASIGLVIWASFLIFMSYLEYKLISSVLGGVVQATTGVFKAAFRGMFASSKKDSSTPRRAEIQEIIKSELSHLMTKNDFEQKFSTYLEQLPSQEEELSELKQEVKKLLSEIQDLEGKSLDEMAAAPKNTKFYLLLIRNTLISFGVKRLLMSFFQEFLETRYPAESLVADVIEEFQSLLNSSSADSQTRKDTFSDSKGTETERIRLAVKEGQVEDQEGFTEVEQKLLAYVYKIDSYSQKYYSQIKESLQKLMSDSPNILQQVKEGVSSFQIESLAPYLQKFERLSQEQIASIEHAYSEIKEEALHQFQLAKQQTHNLLDEAQEVGVQQAESLRKISRAAAWWALSLSLLSALAAIAGGIVAT